MHENEYRKYGTSNFVVHFGLIFTQLFNTVIFSARSHIDLLSDRSVTQYKFQRIGNSVFYVFCEIFEICCWRGTEKKIWIDRVKHEEILCSQ
jgi:hypothetical protein